MVRRKLIELRGKRSRNEIAKSVGITTQMLGAIERGARTPSLELAKKIADFYRKKVDDIFFAPKRNELFPENESANENSA
ncbi:transcriptional regulator [Paenibacillus sp. BIHB 4019]|uniref:Transcriptional regulator n=1 Tax=Paenibacillus sp. BIHB 4019 TaxID=1870819 RepID=A0A1B2DRW0_9BACL|nr:helix-turn-helix domain-containing protein [Paenibacillus sp. BIHB 4019]ANY70441.1 transcriptional regulator [Paenibacillus sp. BIHB 4019]